MLRVSYQHTHEQYVDIYAFTRNIIQYNITVCNNHILIHYNSVNIIITVVGLLLPRQLLRYLTQTILQQTRHRFKLPPR